METNPTIDQAVGFFDAHTVELYPDVRDRAVHTVIDTRSGDGSTVRFFNAAEEGIMKLRSADVSKRFQPLFYEKLGGVRHAEVGVVSVIEETHTDVDKITSFFEDATSDEPWLVIVEPN